MVRLPNGLRTFIVSLISGSVVTGIIWIKVIPQNNSSNPSDQSENSTLPTSSVEPNQNLETVKILVRDSKSDLLLSGVEIEIVANEEVIREKTFDDGSFKVQIPKQKLREVYISLRRPGYKPILKKPTNLSVDPNKSRTFYLEPDEGQTNSSSEYTPTATIKTKKEVYAEGEPIEVEYFGLPGKYQDLIVLTNSSTSEKNWNRYLDKRKNVGTKGNITFDGIPPGNYEIRTYYNYRPGSYFRLIGRYSIEVK
jgi:hypothetical protein